MQIRRTLKKYDTSAFRMPRQYTDTALEKPMRCLIFLVFSRVRERAVVGFRPHLDHLKRVKNTTKTKQMGALHAMKIM